MFDDKSKWEVVFDANVTCNNSLLSYSDSLKGFHIDFKSDTFRINVKHDELKDHKRIISSDDVNSYQIFFFLGEKTDVYVCNGDIYSPVYVEKNSFAVHFGITDRKQVVEIIESIHKGKYDTIRTSFSSHGTEGYLALIHSESYVDSLYKFKLSQFRSEKSVSVAGPYIGDFYEMTIFQQTLTIRFNKYVNHSERKKILAMYDTHEAGRIPGGDFRWIKLANNSGLDVFEKSIKLYEHPEVNFVKIHYIQFKYPY
ncbi:MAG: hypothetical protein COA32_05860 [Fluviicola sp.]|nr:MAG: hypothetical protein COA32_05860 [Fluviicola sp.]